MENNNLKYIMDLLRITGQKLAEMLSVDRTLVSKWKNGSRPFDPSISHFNKVIDAILNINEEQNIQTLERFFEEIIPDIDKDNKDWVKQALRMWLSGNIDKNNILKTESKNKTLYTTNISIYDGNIGKRNAVLEFFDYALSLPPGQELLLSDMEDMSWLLENKQFMTLWQKNMVEILKKDHQISIIHNTGRDIESVSNIVFNWLPLYYSGKLASYYYQNIDPNVSAPTVYVIKNHMAIMCMSSTKYSKDRYTAIYKDPFSVSQMEKVFNTRLTVSHKLVSLYSFNHKDIEKLTNKLVKLGQKKDEAYLLTPVPVFTTMAKDTLIEVLKENEIQKDLSEQIIKIHKGIQDFFLKDINKYFCRQFYNIDVLRENSDMEKIPYLELSSFALKPIMVSNKLYKEHINNLNHFIKSYENFEVSLIPFEKYPLPEKASIWVKQNCFVYSYPQYQGKALTLSSESMTVNGFYQQLEKLWNSVPIVNKDKKWVSEQLNKLVE